MKYNSEKHNRKSIRLKNYDYSKYGFYYVTICTQDRGLLFGDIKKNDKSGCRDTPCGCPCSVLELNTAGQMVDREWNQISKRFGCVVLDKYIVMPNHFHGIIQIVDGVNTGDEKSCFEIQTKNNNDIYTNKDTLYLKQIGMGTSPIPTLFDVIGAFKSLTTTKYITGVKEDNWPPFQKRIWQLRYHDRIIRNEDELNRIRKYIIENPIHWDDDKHNPTQSSIIECFDKKNSMLVYITFPIKYDINKLSKNDRKNI
jgi:putative transposase